MGMTLSLYSLSPQDVDALRATPALVSKLLALDDSSPAKASLDKAWHGIHYLLTGSAWEGEAPLNFLLHGGELVGDGDDDDAPSLFNHERVRAIDAALSAVSIDQLRARYDPKAMLELDIYPAIWEEGEQALDYCLRHFGELQSFVAAIAREERSMVVFIG